MICRDTEQFEWITQGMNWQLRQTFSCGNGRFATQSRRPTLNNNNIIKSKQAQVSEVTQK